ncbi:MAG TPA: hypothetical protein DCS07_01745 [Bdellovibrionales bacterium]|nr:MAG: hypothetical protein A2Z97_15350 [Bdellovibrionales bacterium GWB1_52_6]OFZ03950.1 MAG: hypothetical protein A2X97_08440 [Bdellovibrionales bacterium GWA1_52_35]OFZ37646.1 MAG: hypothetical protein A2070_00680 [Bdellovibrionales bacterium GWC1_52_8]HAR41347.1 hypothetical protein [Bdellovibrionales bacterium]HCM39763.1 hypothetical protein [Bdellovibrionales bacterium]
MCRISYRKIIESLVLGLLICTLQPGSAFAGPTHKNIIVLRNGIPINPAKPPALKIGDTITVEALTRGTQSAPLDYSFMVFHGGNGGIVRFTKDNKYSYKIRPQDVLSEDLSLNVLVRSRGGKSDDAREIAEIEFGEIKDGVERLPAKIQNLEVSLNGKQTTIEQLKNLKVGDTIQVKTLANDPKGLPLKYDFMMFKGINGGAENYRDDNHFTYKIAPEDALYDNLELKVSVRNNNGKNKSNGEQDSIWIEMGEVRDRNGRVLAKAERDSCFSIMDRVDETELELAAVLAGRINDVSHSCLEIVRSLSSAINTNSKKSELGERARPPLAPVHEVTAAPAK